MVDTVLGGAVIHYMDGTRDEFIFTRGQVEAGRALKRLEEMMHSNMLFFRLDDRMLAIPTHNIRKIEVKPPPPEMPDSAVENVRQVT